MSEKPSSVRLKRIRLFGPREIQILEELMGEVMRNRSGVVRVEVAPKHLMIGGCALYAVPLGGELDAKFNQVVKDVTTRPAIVKAGGPPNLGDGAKEE